MTFIKTRSLLLFTLLLASIAVLTQGVLAQQATQEKKPAVPPVVTQQAESRQPADVKKTDHAGSYYHFALAHMYEEMMAMYGRSEFATKAIEEYRLAIESDPSSEFLNAALAELYAK